MYVALNIKVVQKSQSKRFATKLLYKTILFLQSVRCTPEADPWFFFIGGGGGGPIFDSENTIETLFVANYFIPNTVVSTLLAVTCFNQFI